MDAARDRRTAPEQLLRFLPLGLRLLGVTWGGFFAVLLLARTLGLADDHSLFFRATIWGGWDESILMICVMNIVIGAFIVRSARDPWAYRHVIDFALAVNAPHQALMLVLGFVSPERGIHPVTDIPAGVGHTILFALLWLPARRALAGGSARPSTVGVAGA
jgi:hypothetical protein